MEYLIPATYQKPMKAFKNDFMTLENSHSVIFDSQNTKTNFLQNATTYFNKDIQNTFMSRKTLIKT